MRAQVPAHVHMEELGAEMDGDGEDFGEEDDEKDGENGFDQVVLTETKLVTVTRTVTKSFTVTVTLSDKPSAAATRVGGNKVKRHAQKGRRPAGQGA